MPQYIVSLEMRYSDNKKDIEGNIKAVRRVNSTDKDSAIKEAERQIISLNGSGRELKLSKVIDVKVIQ